MPPEPSGNIELVPTSKMPQPQAQPQAAPGASAITAKPPPTFKYCEANFFFFILRIENCETPPSAGLRLKEFGFYEPANASSIFCGDGDTPSLPDWNQFRP